MEIGESTSIPSELVDVRRLDLAPVTANIGEAQVIGEEDQEVGRLACHGGDGRQCAGQAARCEGDAEMV